MTLICTSNNKRRIHVFWRLSFKKNVTALILLIGDFSQNIMKLMSLSKAQSVIWCSQIRWLLCCMGMFFCCYQNTIMQLCACNEYFLKYCSWKTHLYVQEAKIKCSTVQNSCTMLRSGLWGGQSMTAWVLLCVFLSRYAFPLSAVCLGSLPCC